MLDDENSQANIELEDNVKITQQRLDEFGENFDKNGRIDFLLLDPCKKPLVVLETKSKKKHPLSAKEQAREYTKNPRDARL